MLQVLPFLLISVITLSSCDKKNEGLPGDCQSIVLHQPFTARIGETWCIPATGWSIRLDTITEDSRCNVLEYVCVWAGQLVMEATVNEQGHDQVTFVADHDWRDTLYTQDHTIILQKILPETRDSWEILPPQTYAFEIIVK